MDKAITTVFLIVISMVLAMMLFNAAYPAISDSSSALLSMAERADDRYSSQVKIIHAAGELDSDGWWQDTNGNGYFETFVWVKNVGATRVIALDQIDVFFGPEGNFSRIPHQSDAGGSYPYWDWQLENASEWTPTATLKIAIHHSFPLTAGRYFLKVTIPNGVSDDYYLGM
jgi:hypothetical protein